MPPRTSFWGIFKIFVVCLFAMGFFIESMYSHVYCVKWSSWGSLSTINLNFLKKSFFGVWPPFFRNSGQKINGLFLGSFML